MKAFCAVFFSCPHGYNNLSPAKATSILSIRDSSKFLHWSNLPASSEFCVFSRNTAEASLLYRDNK